MVVENGTKLSSLKVTIIITQRLKEKSVYTSEHKLTFQELISTHEVTEATLPAVINVVLHHTTELQTQSTRFTRSMLPTIMVCINEFG